MDILSTLNKAQTQAATHIDGPMLILSGAGSGKTKTITTRLAYLISEIGVDPLDTLTLTFTNKAAGEMKARALALLNAASGDGVKNANPLLCTFHKFGLLFLKFHIGLLNRSNSFVIIDTDDKKKILKELEDGIAPAVIASEISKLKNSLISPAEALESSPINYSKHSYEKIAKAYKLYEERLVANNLVDFDDLLALPYKILLENEPLATEISNRYRYIMVDEYQDTNELQYKLLKRLCLAHDNLVVVGDDDQSIYGWRGAKIDNILSFKDQFSGTKVIKLEENYRSTPSILKAANELIDHNRSRLGKKLFSSLLDKSPIEIIENGDENMESKIIASRVSKLLDSGVNAGDIAILYRVNALSRSLEDGLNHAKIPYKMVGGIKFYERAEIKDIISYLRLILNPHDDFSLIRIINRPKRGLGQVTIDKLQKFAFEKRISLFNAIYAISESDISKKPRQTLFEFAEQLQSLSAMMQNGDADEGLLAQLEGLFGIKEYYKNQLDGEDKARNIDEFYALLNDQIANNSSFSLEEFLNELTLQSEQDRIDGGAISIMSVHASKGLEFEHLFVIGLEEGFFPLLGETSDIEEERRLAYVAITRAKSGLALSFANSRFYKGQRTRLNKSRFLSEAGLCEGSLRLEKSSEHKKGELVKHKIFGIGRVLEATKVKGEFKLKINFGGNIKEIMSSFVQKVV